MKNITEVIKSRESTRNYQKDADLTSKLALLETYINELNTQTGPFGNIVRVTIVSSTADSSQMKLGTYGMIKGANHYLVVTVSEAPNYLLDVGYQFEKVILYATSIGLSTVWMGGTFSRKHFRKALGDDQVEMPIVSPIGIKSENPRLVTKYLIKSKNHIRKPFADLFFESDGTTPLAYIENDPYMAALELVRIAPSAMNKQPWRVVKDADDYHFYSASKLPTSDIDLGIAICHFDLRLNDSGIFGSFTNCPNDTLSDYVVTWKGNH
ncbi:nitroreductase family protein [Mollicutes bacterium LVI A0039]|nr:nitroreductase family protein [Mollicutes bacterium LVI A0039]